MMLDRGSHMHTTLRTQQPLPGRPGNHDGETWATFQLFVLTASGGSLALGTMEGSFFSSHLPTGC